MAQTRKEHIVPQMLLSQFTAADGKLWVYEKGRDPRPSRPENECVERDFYEFEFLGDKTNNAYENWLGRIETDAKSLLEITKRSRQFSRREPGLWAIFVASLYARNRKDRERVSAMMGPEFRRRNSGPDAIRDQQHRLLKQGILIYAEDLQRAQAEIDSTQEWNPSYFQTFVLPHRVPKIAKALLTRDWRLIEAPPDTSFLVSDCPVVTYEVQRGQVLPDSGFGLETTVVLLPVSPQRLWVASPCRMVWPTIFTPSGMKNANRLIVRFAHRNVYANEASETIKTLVDTQINTVNFLRNVDAPPVNENQSHRPSQLDPTS